MPDPEHPRDVDPEEGGDGRPVSHSLSARGLTVRVPALAPAAAPLRLRLRLGCSPPHPASARTPGHPPCCPAAASGPRHVIQEPKPRPWSQARASRSSSPLAVLRAAAPQHPLATCSCHCGKDRVPGDREQGTGRGVGLGACAVSPESKSTVLSGGL